jgi:hypothetical protein
VKCERGIRLNEPNFALPNPSRSSFAASPQRWRAPRFYSSFVGCPLIRARVDIHTYQEIGRKSLLDVCKRSHVPAANCLTKASYDIRSLQGKKVVERWKTNEIRRDQADFL